MKLALLSSALLLVLASCSTNKHVNPWERQSSALDPVGITSKKMAAKANAEQAVYKPGDSITFKKEKLVVFEQNPESSFSTSGKVMNGADSAKVLVCGELFAKVEFEDGRQGYVSLRKSSIRRKPWDSSPFPVPICSARTADCCRCLPIRAPLVRKPRPLPGNWI